MNRSEQILRLEQIIDSIVAAKSYAETCLMTFPVGYAKGKVSWALDNLKKARIEILEAIEERQR